MGVIPPVRPVPTPAWAKGKSGFTVMEPTTEPSIRGIALGGIGAGAFQINQSGTFGPWSFGSQELRILPQAAFHVRVAKPDGAPIVRTLAMDGPLGKLPVVWPQISPGSARYAAEYPFGWIDYDGLNAKVGLRFWSPIVAGEDRRTSMPLAYFDFTVANPTQTALTVSLMFTFPNAPIHVPGSGRMNWMTKQPVHIPPSVRTGLSSRVDRFGNVVGVTLAANDATNTIDAEGTAWTIAAEGGGDRKVSFTTSWAGDGDGSDILSPFVSRGELPDGALDDSHAAGAIAVTVSLAPGESKTIAFSLAWDVPREIFTVASSPAEPANAFRPARPAVRGGTTVWMKRYTEFLGAQADTRNDYVVGSYRLDQSFRIAATGLRERRQSLNDVLAWWSPIAANSRVPGWLRAAALNQMQYLTFGGSFWAFALESDSVGSPDGRRLGGAIPGTHPFFVLTGAEGGDESAMNGDVSPYADLVTQMIFPNIERDILRTYGELLRRSPVAQLHDLGNADGGSPFVMWDNSGGNNHMDRTILFAVRWWRYVKPRRGDPLFEWLYPAVVETWRRHEANFFRNGSVLPFDPPFLANTHDMLTVHGHGVYNSGLWILFLDLLSEATEQAQAQGFRPDADASVASFRAAAASARDEFEAAFWDESRGYYRFDTGDASAYSDGLFAEALYADSLAASLDMRPIARTDRARRHLHAVDRLLIAPFEDAQDQPIGAANLTDGRGVLFGGLNIGDKPLGEAPGGREMWPGANYPLAALMIAVGKRTKDDTLIARGLALGRGVSHIIWGRPDLGYAFLAPEAWAAENPAVHRNPHYMRPLSVWDLWQRVADEAKQMHNVR